MYINIFFNYRIAEKNVKLLFCTIIKSILKKKKPIFFTSRVKTLV